MSAMHRVMYSLVLLSALFAMQAASANSVKTGGWNSMGGFLQSSPGCVVFGADYQCFGQNGQMFQIARNLAAGEAYQTGWIALGGGVTDSPSCVSFPHKAPLFIWQALPYGSGGSVSSAGDLDTQALFCAIRGTDGGLWFREYKYVRHPVVRTETSVVWGQTQTKEVFDHMVDGSSWSGWTPMGGGTIGAPFCLAGVNSRIICFVQGTDNALHSNVYDSAITDGKRRPGNILGWRGHGGVIAGAPACFMRGGGVIDCFVRNSGNGLFHIGSNNNGDSFGGFTAIGHARTVPHCLLLSNNTLDCYMVGNSGNLQQMTWNGGAQFYQLDGGLASVVPQVLGHDNLRRVYAIGSDSSLYVKEWYPHSGWNAWHGFGGGITGDRIQCIMFEDAHSDCVVRGSDGAYHQHHANYRVTAPLAENADPMQWAAQNVFASPLFQKMTGAFNIRDVKLVSYNPVGETVISGTVSSLGNTLTSNAIRGAIGLRKFLLNDDRNDVPVRLILKNQGGGNFQVILSFAVMRGWVQVNGILPEPLGTSVAGKDADVHLIAEYSNGEPTYKIGATGTMYVRPTNRDPWLYVEPGVYKQVAADDPSIDYELSIKGACTVFGGVTQSTDPNLCNTNWKPFGQPVYEARSVGNGGRNDIAASVVGGAVVGFQLDIENGLFLREPLNAHVNATEDPAEAVIALDVNLAELNNKVKSAFPSNLSSVLAAIGMGNVMDSVQVKHVYMSYSSALDPNDNGTVQAEMVVMGENVRVAFKPGNPADMYAGLATAIARVVSNKTGLPMTELVTFALDVYNTINDVPGVSYVTGGATQAWSETQKVFEDVGEALNPANWF